MKVKSMNREGRKGKTREDKDNEEMKYFPGFRLYLHFFPFNRDHR